MLGQDMVRLQVAPLKLPLWWKNHNLLSENFGCIPYPSSHDAIVESAAFFFKDKPTTKQVIETCH